MVKTVEALADQRVEGSGERLKDWLVHGLAIHSWAGYLVIMLPLGCKGVSCKAWIG